MGPGLTCQLDMTAFFKLTNFEWHDSEFPSWACLDEIFSLESLGI